METLYGQTDGVFADQYAGSGAAELGEAWSSTSSGTSESTLGLPNLFEQFDDEGVGEVDGFPARRSDAMQAAESPLASESALRSDTCTHGETEVERPLLKRGSRGEAVARAQRLLNRFLPRISEGPGDCVDLSPSRIDEIRTLLSSLRRNGQLPLVVDGRFGPNTEHATRLFQACIGLARDGTVGPVTWHYLERYQPAHKSYPPDTAGCGVPDQPSAELERQLDLEREMADEARSAGVSVRPRLSFFQNTTKTIDRNHFQAGATRVARILSAYADPRVDSCSPRRVGPTAYTNGADIIAAIEAAQTCLGERITAVHIFSHSGDYGVFGPEGRSEGLYRDPDYGDRPAGARSIADIATRNLANDVVVVLHGCNLANGSGSFAEHLYRHLAFPLTAPVVFGHWNTGCAGRDDSWVRFDAKSPTGRRMGSAAPHYTAGLICQKPQHEGSEGEGFGDGRAATTSTQPLCRCGSNETSASEYSWPAT